MPSPGQGFSAGNFGVFSELVATTFRAHQKDVSDNVSKHNALFRRLSQGGKVRLEDGGLSIAMPLEYANNSTYTRYSGFDVLAINAVDVLSAAEYPWRQVAVNIAISGLEMRTNSGEARIVNFVKAKIKNAQNSLANGLSVDMYSDGTAANQINGLQALVADAGTGTVGGINSSTYAFWQNVVQSAATPLQGGSAITPSASTIESLMLPLWIRLTRGNSVPQLATALRTYNALPKWAKYPVAGAFAGGAAGAGNAREGDVLEGAGNVARTHGYDDLLNNGSVEFTPELQQLMTSDTMKAAMARARSILSDDIATGRASNAVDHIFREMPAESVLEPQFIDGRMVLRPASSPTLWTARGALQEPTETVGEVVARPTLRGWDYVKRGLDAIIYDPFKGADPLTGKMTSQAESALNMKRIMLGHIDAANPEYAAARAAYADEKAGEEALKLGRIFMQEDSEVTARRLADMTSAERQYFKAGAARQVQDMIRSRPDTGMAYADWIKRPLFTDKLKAAFGDDTAGFDRFMQQMRSERTMGETHAALGKGSDTAARQAAAQDAGMPITTADIPTSKMEALRAGLRYLTAPSQETSAQLARLLLSPDQAARDNVIQRLMVLDEKMNRPALVLTPQNKQIANLLLTKQAGQSGSNQ